MVWNWIETYLSHFIEDQHPDHTYKSIEVAPSITYADGNVLPSLGHFKFITAICLHEIFFCRKPFVLSTRYWIFVMERDLGRESALGYH